MESDSDSEEFPDIEDLIKYGPRYDLCQELRAEPRLELRPEPRLQQFIDLTVSSSENGDSNDESEWEGFLDSPGNEDEAPSNSDENPGNEDSGEEASGEEDSGEEDSSEEDSGEEASGEEDSGEEDSGEEDSGEEDCDLAV
ncbi:hypothetical protein QBC33DRAFT_544621 [Phialemonium atrogriseum]|uniref:Uncharacterized protein n=1 Tax=Phialemonium atrogriseum TaxID=1093897 RepID=A0AAJ0BY43_9PEZI|nr:uncharacterized protein QBC33DRAFT_544621 [Phialemonium atrogriseum]KAK1765543.1 hypothetical protein QBC33DRAFT_544621 [Phialemonium atrogriseum]